MFESAATTTALDVPTLLFIATAIAALLGLFMIIAWLQERSLRALAWWGSAYLIGGSSMALWSFPTQALPLPPAVPSALIFVACGRILNGVRLFHGRRLLPLATVAGAFVWLLATAALPLSAQSGARLMVAAIIVSAYTFFIAFELSRERRRSLYSFTAAIVVPSLHAAIFMLPILMKTLTPQGQEGIANLWFALFAVETMLYAVGTAFIVLLLVKDYQVYVHKSAASTDPLTGLVNRRAFQEAAEVMRAYQARKRQPVTVMMFDLDHFKSINDRFGHAIGDQALQLFAATARANMRANDVIARLGGEEFAALLPGTLELASRIAERIRANFEKSAVEICGHRINATVSIGLASAPGPGAEVSALLVRADGALYRAKLGGRNRVYADEGPPHTVTTAGRLIAAARNDNAMKAAEVAQSAKDQQSAA